MGGVTRLIWSAVKFWKAGNKKKKFNDTNSREELKTNLVRLNDFYDGFVQPKSLSAIFQSSEDDLPESGRSLKQISAA